MVKKCSMLLLLSAMAVYANPASTNVESTTGNLNLKNTLDLHEEVMIKLVSDVDKNSIEVSGLREEMNQKETEIASLKAEIAAIKQSSLESKKHEAIESSKYDSEFKKYLNSNR